MTNYLLPGKIPEHYYFRHSRGICLKTRTAAGLWQEETTILPEGQDGFGAYADTSGKTHIICTDSKNRLIYSVRKDNEQKNFTLTSLSADISVLNMRLYNVGGRLNLLYSALYNEEYILVHCILGDRAKPCEIAKLESPYFFIYENNVYFTNPHGELEYISLADEKPVGFIPVSEDAHSAYLCSFGGREFLIYTRGSRLFINNEEILSDSRMEAPICVKNGDKLYVMWKSGGFIRYIASFNGAATWSEPMRFMNSGASAELFFAQQGESVCHFYGYRGEKEPALLGAPDIFSERAECTLPAPTELEKLKIMLDITRRELLEIKKDLSRLQTAEQKPSPEG